MCNADTIENLEQGTAEALTIVSIIHLCKSEQCGLALPLSWMVFFNPMPSDSKVSIRIAGLPRITCNIDGSADRITLQDILDEGESLKQ